MTTIPITYAAAMHELVAHHSRELAAILSATHQVPPIQTNYSPALDLPLTHTFRPLHPPNPTVIARYTPSSTALDVAVEYLAPTLNFTSPLAARHYQYDRNTELHRALQYHGYSTPPDDSEWDPTLRIHHSRVYTHSVSTHRMVTSQTRSLTAQPAFTSLDYTVTLKERLF